MFASLKNHPFAVEAFFEKSIVLTFAAPKETLQHLIPPCLSLDTFQDEWAFVAMAMVQTKGLRPKGFPAMFGHSFLLTGFRIFTRYTTSQGKKLRGLYILKSETDKRSMALLGNFFTHYNYTQTDISMQTSADKIQVFSKQSDIDVLLQSTEIEHAMLPPESPFQHWEEARKYAGPLPFTFTYNGEDKSVLIIEGVRQYWKPAPLQVLNQHIGFLKQMHLPGLVLANAFIIENIPYYWKKGKTDAWIET